MITQQADIVFNRRKQKPTMHRRPYSLRKNSQIESTSLQTGMANPSNIAIKHGIKTIEKKAPYNHLPFGKSTDSFKKPGLLEFGIGKDFKTKETRAKDDNSYAVVCFFGKINPAGLMKRYPIRKEIKY